MNNNALLGISSCLTRLNPGTCVLSPTIESLRSPSYVAIALTIAGSLLVLPITGLKARTMSHCAKVCDVRVSYSQSFPRSNCPIEGYLQVLDVLLP